MSSLWPWILLTAAAHTFLVCRRILAYLRYFQQEGYEAVRFLTWSNVRSLTDPAFWWTLVCASLATWSAAATTVAFVAGAIFFGALQPDPRRSGKIPLRMTWRARRVFALTVVLSSALWMMLTAAFDATGWQAPLLASAIVIVLMPLVLVVANLALVPYEQLVQNSYERDAVRRVREVAPQIIGITGSYGKSSSKSMLAHILQFHAPTLAASGSINTLMGITRHIREALVFGHRFMVVEMGAFKTGSIRRLCELTPPSAGLITAVGDMHLERFGSTDEIVRAKGELAEALAPGGLLVVNADSPGALTIARRNTHCQVLLYGEHSTEDLDTRVERMVFSKTGTSFVLRTKQGTYECFTPLLGRPIILNLAGAFTMATALGVDPSIAVAALRTLKPVSNRLEVVEERGVTWIRDAYNSNQFGFRAALEVAAALPVARRFLATPGVIELGAQQFDVNRALSKEASGICDHTIVVAATNREAFVAGHRDAGREPRLVPVANRGDAFRWLKEHVQEGDAVILENDLPDLYERSAGVFWKERAAAGRAEGAPGMSGERTIDRRRTVAVLFGGRSLEHDVSIVSGLQILHAIDPGPFLPMPIYIDQNTRWWIGDDLWHADHFKRGGPDRSRLTEVTLSSGFGTSTLVPVGDAIAGLTPPTPVDVFVPVLHGTFGEDGCLQGVLELGGCAYVGCPVLASAVGMNKRLTKVVAKHHGVPVVPWVSCDRAVLERGSAWLRELPAEVESTLKWPVIVKPCNLGSSAGVSTATSADELIAGVLKVFEYDIEALIEPFVKNRLEINVAVAGLDEPVASVTEMPLTSQGSPLSFSEKYKRQGTKSVGSSQGMAGALRVLDPEDLPTWMRLNAQRYATRVFAALGCEGISRIDFLIDADTNTLYFNEINTLPGSLAFYLWSAAPHHWTITDLLSRLIARAERVRAMKRGLQRRPPPELQLLS